MRSAESPHADYLDWFLEIGSFSETENAVEFLKNEKDKKRRFSRFRK